jgi:hypothetical protein
MTYYYNEATGESQWEPPQPGTAHPDYSKSQAVWSVGGVRGVSGFTYREGSAHLDPYRDLPYTVCTSNDIVLGRWNMVAQKIHVSREQCKVKVAGDGTATLISCGKPPTLWRSRTAVSWDALLKWDEKPLSDGDMISLDAQDRDAAVFVVERAVQQGDSAGYAYLPAGWLQGVDEATGEPFYYNEQTGQSQWDYPQ